MSNIKLDLAGLRGGAYFDVWADFWKGPEGQAIRAEVVAQRATGDFKVSHVVRICDKHNLPWKTFVEQLEKDSLLQTGLYERMPPIKKLREAVYAEQEAQTT